MLAYFVRKLSGSIATLAFASFIIFTITVEIPGLHGPEEQINAPQPEGWDQLHARIRHVDRPWPYNYLAWLFDTQAPNLDYLIQNKYVTIAKWGEHTRPAGILTGFLGYSSEMVLGESVSKIYGEVWWLIPSALLLISIVFMIVATLQRWRRPPPYHAAYIHASATRDNRHLGRFRVFSS